MIAADTSVVVPGFGSWHPAFGAVDGILRRRPRLPVNVVLETYSVLTRMPRPYRATPPEVRAYLEPLLREPPLGLPPSEYVRLLDEVADAGLSGRAVFDAAIALAAKKAGAKLVTRDRRALPAYELVGADVELIGRSRP